MLSFHTKASSQAYLASFRVLLITSGDIRRRTGADGRSAGSPGS